MSRDVVVLLFPDFQLLDAAGPIAAFEIAARYEPDAYRLRMVAARPGAVTSSAGAVMHASAFRAPRRVDTLLIAGGDGSRAAALCARTRRYVLACAKAARRVASVCSGSYILATAGLLDDRRATTHWSLTADFAARFPRVRLEPDRIFVKAGNVWSSAGITAGIDLALAMIAEDLGEGIARRTAQQLVVYYRRPGGQSQYSTLLDLDRANGRFAALLDHVRRHLGEALDVDSLARFCRMSPRHFARAFRAEVGTSPAKAVLRMRVEVARAALESGGHSVQVVARAAGFGSAERMRRGFLRLLGTPPAAVRSIHHVAVEPP